MGASKYLLGALATFLIAIGVAAQTGTLHVARPARHTQAATASPQPRAVIQPPEPLTLQPSPPAPPAPPPAAAPVQTNGDQGDSEGDGGGD
jgi:hypothetical protein